jgi:hypothetical protein
MKVSAIKKILTVFATGAIACCVASASTITYTATPYSNTTDFTTTLLLQQWDPSLFPGEVLTGAVVNYNVSVTPGTVTLTNTTTQNESFRFTATSEADLSGLPDTLTPDIFAMPTFATGLITLGKNTFPPCAFATPSSACSSVQYSPSGISGSGTSSSTPGTLTSYQGVGDLTLDVTTLSGSTFVGGGNNVTASISETASISASVTYTYQDSGAPEPATMATLGSALIGLALIGRKRFAR